MRRLTPHSGYHFDGSNRRFFEGWYFKVCSSSLTIIVHEALSDSRRVQALPLGLVPPRGNYRCAAQVTLPGSGQSFALIYSVADPAGSNRLSSTAAQARLCAVQISQ